MPYPQQGGTYGTVESVAGDMERRNPCQDAAGGSSIAHTFMLFLVLFLNDRPSVPPVLSEVECISFGQSAYIFATDNHTIGDFVNAFGMSTTEEGKAEHGIVIQLDQFAGAAPRHIAKKLVEWKDTDVT